MISPCGFNLHFSNKQWKSLSHVWLCNPMDCIQAEIREWVAFSFSRGNPGFELRSPTLQADSLPAEPQGKPKNTGVGSLSLLQGILPTQEPNWDLLHCRQILYQLSYEGTSVICEKMLWEYVDILFSQPSYHWAYYAVSFYLVANVSFNLK